MAPAQHWQDTQKKRKGGAKFSSRSTTKCCRAIRSQFSSARAYSVQTETLFRMSVWRACSPVFRSFGGSASGIGCTVSSGGSEEGARSETATDGRTLPAPSLDCVCISRRVGDTADSAMPKLSLNLCRWEPALGVKFPFHAEMEFACWLSSQSRDTGCCDTGCRDTCCQVPLSIIAAFLCCTYGCRHTGGGEEDVSGGAGCAAGRRKTSPRRRRQ